MAAVPFASKVIVSCFVLFVYVPVIASAPTTMLQVPSLRNTAVAEVFVSDYLSFPAEMAEIPVKVQEELVVCACAANCPANIAKAATMKEMIRECFFIMTASPFDLIRASRLEVVYPTAPAPNAAFCYV